jgi:membrane protein DedA with SNARE-associated domain
MFDWIVAVVVAGGLLGVAFLMFAENVLPPVPSEVVMPLAGFAAAQGHMSFEGVIAAGTAGAVAGASGWNLVGRRLPEEKLGRLIDRHGRWLTLDRDDLRRSTDFFRRRGAAAVFLGRLVPGVRTLISVPAGVVRMPWPKFLLWTTLGTAAWTSALAAAGYLLAHEYRRVEAWLDPATLAVAGLVAALYLYRLVRRKGA